jgi:alkaline phosphatase D
MMKLVQISDIHLSEKNRLNQANWDWTVDYVNHTMPDLVIITGDLVLDDPDDPDDLAHAAREIRRLRPQWLALAGNHDIGDTGARPFCGQRVSEARLARFRLQVGPDWWRRDMGGWTFLGINDFLLDEPLASSEAQYAWLASIAPTLADRMVAVFTHKPLFLTEDAETEETIYTISPRGRRRLRGYLEGVGIRFWGAGHSHNGRILKSGGELHVWAPALSHINHEENFPFEGDRRAGIVEYVFCGASVSASLVAPPGVSINDVTDLFSRYPSFRFAPGAAAAGAIGGAQTGVPDRGRRSGDE